MKANYSCAWDTNEHEGLPFRSENAFAQGRPRRPRNRRNRPQSSILTARLSRNAIPSALSFPLESHAVNFWVANFGLEIDELDDFGNDHSLYLVPHWHRAPSDSSLKIALLAVAHAAFGCARPSDAAVRDADVLYHQTVTRVKDEIRTVSANNIEYLLLAVKQMENFEVRFNLFQTCRIRYIVLIEF